MGNILWWRKRPPSEELDELVVQIRELETQLKQLLNDRTGILRWLNCFVLLVVTVLSALGWLQHGPLRKRLLSVAFVWLCALLVLALFRYLITSAFGWLIRRKRNRINLFVERKLAIIENVKKNENYNVAVEYIKKYCDEGAMEKKNGGGANGNNSPSFGRANKNGGGASRRRGSKEENGGAGEQHQFHNTTPNGGGVRHAATSVPQSAAIGADTNNTKMVLPKLYEMQDKDMTPRWASSSMFASATPSYLHHHQRTPIRPFIEPSRTPVDRVLDFLVGESINSRYALICSTCHTHNGMALQEEFDSLSFLCFKCNSFNPSKNEQKLTVMSSSSSSTPTSAPPGVVNEDNKSET